MRGGGLLQVLPEPWAGRRQYRTVAVQGDSGLAQRSSTMQIAFGANPGIHEAVIPFVGDYVAQLVVESKDSRTARTVARLQRLQLKQGEPEVHERKSCLRRFGASSESGVTDKSA